MPKRHNLAEQLSIGRMIWGGARWARGFANLENNMKRLLLVAGPAAPAPK
jgi:hypothetical protein